MMIYNGVTISECSPLKEHTQLTPFNYHSRKMYVEIEMSV